LRPGRIAAAAYNRTFFSTMRTTLPPPGGDSTEAL
jgi:hypothetical protein